MALIPLSGKKAAGRSASVDDDMAGALMEWRWHCNHNGYAARTVYCGVQDGKQKTRMILLHHEVLRLAGVEIPTGHEADHINGDRLDDRIENLRPATHSQNQHNCKPRGGTSRYKGVSWHKKAGKWRACIKRNSKTIHLGLFTDEIDAVKAYDTAARRLHGEFASCNFPGVSHDTPLLTPPLKNSSCFSAFFS